MTSELYHGDAFELLPRFAGANFDAVVTDPPLHVGHDNFAGMASVWRDAFEDGSGLRLLAHRLLATVKPGAVAVVSADTRCVLACGNAFKAAGWEYLRLVSVNREPTGQWLFGWGVTIDHMLVFAAPGRVQFHSPADLDLYDDQGSTPHPVGKSVSALRRIVRNACPQGGTVFDPFMGSGTTGLACKEEARKFVGIESEQHWFEVASKRLKDAA